MSTRAKWIGVGVVVALALGWMLSGDDDALEVRSADTVIRPAPRPVTPGSRPLSTRVAPRLVEPSPEPIAAAPPEPPVVDAAPVAPEEVEASPEVARSATLEVRIVDEQGSQVTNAIVESRDCRFWRRVSDGRAQLELEAESCSVRGARLDGPLATWSAWETVDLDPDQPAALTLTVPTRKTAGMGMRIAQHDYGMAIRWILPGSPAERAGLREGDVVLTVDGREAVDMSPEEFVSVGTGPEGSSVDLLILRQVGDAEEEIDLSLTRQLLSDERG